MSITNIKFKNSQGKFISKEEAKKTEEYWKEMYENEHLVKAEIFYQQELMGLYHYRSDNRDHQSIMKEYLSSDYKWVCILEHENYSGYILERRYGYSLNGILNGINLTLHEPNGELIAHGYKNAEGKYEYPQTYKYYWDKEINPDEELFECTYDEETGMLFELYWNNHHYNRHGQDSFVLLDTEEDINQLIELTGMERSLAEYYMSSEIVPNF